jgi:hypothetical protein
VEIFAGQVALVNSERCRSRSVPFRGSQSGSQSVICGFGRGHLHASKLPSAPPSALREVTTQRTSRSSPTDKSPNRHRWQRRWMRWEPLTECPVLAHAPDDMPHRARPVGLVLFQQPPEDGAIRIARATGRAVFPVRLQLVCTTRSCRSGVRCVPRREVALVVSRETTRSGGRGLPGPGTGRRGRRRDRASAWRWGSGGRGCGCWRAGRAGRRCRRR